MDVRIEVVAVKVEWTAAVSWVDGRCGVEKAERVSRVDDERSGRFLNGKGHRGASAFPQNRWHRAGAKYGFRGYNEVCRTVQKTPRNLP